MPRQRNYKAERAKTVKRKAEHKRVKWSGKHQDELQGIAEGILIDRSINMKETPYFEGALSLLGENTRAQWRDSARSAKHRYTGHEDGNLTAGWERRKYKNRPSKKNAR